MTHRPLACVMAVSALSRDRSRALFACPTALVALCGGLAAQEPASEDRMAALVLELGEHDRSSAAKQLVACGEAAVAPLVRELEPDSPRLYEAARVLGLIGKDARAALPRLTQLMDAWRYRTPDQLYESVGSIGRHLSEVERRDVSVALRNSRIWSTPQGVQLHPPSGATERVLGLAVARLQLGVTPPWEELRRALAGDNPFLKLAAVECIRMRPGGANAFLEELAAATSSRHAGTWELFLGSGQQAHFSHVMAADLSAPIRREASLAIVCAAPDKPVALPAHAWLLRHGDVEERRDAAVMLRQFPEQAQQVVPALIHATSDADLAVLREVVTTLSIFGPAAAEAAAALRRLSRHDDAQLGARAKAALRQIERR